MSAEPVVLPASAAQPAADALSPPRDERRMAWLDALRAIAALLVVYEHLSHFVFYRQRLVFEPWFAAGYAGISLFFLISGYIIPASLERKGSLRGFWVGRIFRLYPLFLFVVGSVVVLQLLGLYHLDPYLLTHRATGALGQASMLPTLLGIPDMLPVTWTLAFEMTFYLLVAALFAVGRHRMSGAVALLLAGIALVFGGSMPVLLLSHSARSTRDTVVLVTIGFVLVLAASLAGRRWAFAGAIVGGLLAAVLLLTNQAPVHHADGLLLPALMFTGTTIYRAEQRQISRWWTVVVPLVVLVAWLVQGYRETGQFPLYLLITLVVVGGLFATGMALRHRRIPRVLAWLGLISYSIYLLHRVVFDTVEPFLNQHRPGPVHAPYYVQALLGAFLLGLVIGLSALTYYLIEAPGQRLGKWLTARVRRAGRRSWPETRPAPAGATAGPEPAPPARR